MIRAVLDTNVLVSAAIREEGKPHRIVNYAKARFEWLTSDFILSEVADVLSRKHIRNKYPSLATLSLRQRYLAQIRRLASVVNVTSSLQVVTDAKDNPVLACAIDGNADYLVTGDPHLRKIGTFEGIKIVTPDEFLRVLQEHEGCA